MADNQTKKSSTNKDETFYFYDLETSGVNPREARIMQFAGQRTTLDLEPIGQPDNLLIRLTPDVVPEPDAILITGIAPQQTLAEGLTEAEFLQYFSESISLPGTIFTGFNSVRFDDEFMRFLHYRNFYDPYEWQWKDNRSRWDLLDVVRMTRALRPDGIQWPSDAGKPTNRLELLTEANGLMHDAAHDALSDVYAVIAVAKLIREKQPRLFDFLLKHRTKQAVASLVTGGQPFVYTSGKYDSAYEKTTVVTTLAKHSDGRGVLVYDLRHDPADFIGMNVDQLVEAWTRKRDDPGIRLPLKALQFNRCPAIAPLSVLDADSQKRLQISLEQMTAHAKALAASDLADKVLAALDIITNGRQASLLETPQPVDNQLYSGFVNDPADKTEMSMIRTAKKADLVGLEPHFTDTRLQDIFPLYKARNFPGTLSQEEQVVWSDFCMKRLTDGGPKSRLAKYFKRLEELNAQSGRTENHKYLLEELRLYGESLMPEPEEV